MMVLDLSYYRVANIAIPVGKWVKFRRFLLFLLLLLIILFFVKSSLSLPCYVVALCIEWSGLMFDRSQGVVEICGFYPVDTVEYLINLQWHQMAF